MSSLCPTEFRDPGSKIIKFFLPLSPRPQRRREGVWHAMSTCHDPFCVPSACLWTRLWTPSFFQGLTVTASNKPAGSASPVSIFLSFFFPCSFFPCAYQTLASPKMRSLSWLSGRVHAEVGGNSPGLLQTVVVRKSLSRITRMWAMPGSPVSGMSIQCAISTSAVC